VDESVALSVFDGRDIVYLLRVPSRKVMSLRLGVGSRLPAYVTSPGRVLLAWQDEAQIEHYLSTVEMKAYTRKTLTTPEALRGALATVRDKGYAWVSGELDPSVCGLSVPVRDEDRNVVVALNVNLLSGETTEAKAVKKMLVPLYQASERLSAMAPRFFSSVVQTVAPRSVGAQRHLQIPPAT
jgi:IclR family pca regulon transcriptional regulator